MQVTEVQSEGLKRQFNITVEASAIEDKVNARLSDLAKRVKLPGFRPGKVPPSVMRQRYGQSIIGEVLEETVNDVTSRAMTDRGLRPAMKPTVEIVSFDQGQDLHYKVDVEVLPEVKPTDFSKLEIERLGLEPTDAEVEQALQRIASSNKKAAEPAEARPVKEGDLVTIDFAGTVDGKELPGMKGEDFRLEVGSKQFIPGFEEQLVGVNVGEQRELKVTFPADYPAENIKGKEAVFQVTVKKLEEQQERVLDDALAKELGLETLDQLKRRVLDALAAAHDFPVPDGMVDLEFQAIWQQIERDRQAGQLDPEDKDKSEEELKKEYRGIAERRVRLGLLLSEVGRQQNVDVSQDEVNNAIMAEVRRFPGQEQQVMNYFRNNAQAVANVRAPIFEQKVIDWIVDQAKVTDRQVTMDEFNQIAEDAPKASERGTA